MITRTAIFEGRVKPGHENEFFAAIRERLAPLWQTFPGNVGMRWFRIDNCDDAERPVVMIQQVDYPSHEVMQAAIASPQRDAARAVTMELMELFEGRFYHVIGEPEKVAG